MLYLSADLHLTKYVWKQRKTLKGDSYRAFMRMAQQIIADPVDEPKTVILAGDVVDTRTLDGCTLAALDAGIVLLLEAGVGVLFTQGNHDINATPHLNTLGAVHLNNKLHTCRDGHVVYGLDYRPREELHQALQTVPECDMLVMHGAMEHLLGFEGAYDLTLQDLPTAARSTLVGDVHITSKKEWNGGFVYSPGALHPCNISEGNEHGYYRKPYGAEAEFVTIPTRQIHRVVIQTANDLEQVHALVDAFPSVPEDLIPIVEIAYITDMEADAKALRRKLANIAVVITCVLREAVDESTSRDAVYNQVTMLEALDMTVCSKAEPEVYDLLSQLVAPEASVDTILQDFTEEKV